MHSDIRELYYQAIEPKFDRIRLASDNHGNIFIISNDDVPYSSPYNIAVASKELYRFIDNMEIMILNNEEYKWVNNLNSFAKSLAAGPC